MSDEPQTPTLDEDVADFLLALSDCDNVQINKRNAIDAYDTVNMSGQFVRRMIAALMLWGPPQ